MIPSISIAGTLLLVVGTGTRLPISVLLFDVCSRLKIGSSEPGSKKNVQKLAHGGT
jgi:hypothetical protein